MYVMVVYWRPMSDTHTPKVNEIISGDGKIVSVYNGYVEADDAWNGSYWDISI